MITLENKPFIKESERGVFLVTLKKLFYEQEAVMQAAYKFTDACFIKIDALDDGYVGIWFKEKPNISIKPDLLLCEFCNEVLDQQVRLDLEKRYGNLRDNIYNFAFSPIKERLLNEDDK